MPNPLIPGFVQANGAFRGYAQGKTRMVANVMHFTVGRYAGDYSIGMRGYFPAYAPREMQPVQFAEIDALTWHAGSWNGDGPGIEFERLSWDEPLTPRQIDVGGEYSAFLHDEWGIPLDFYDGPRVDRWAGFINHGSLLGRGGDRQDHTDGVTRDEWNQMIGEDVTPEEHTMLAELYNHMVHPEAPDWAVDKSVGYLRNSILGTPSLEDRIVARLSGTSGSGTGVSLEQVKDAVRKELDQTRLAPR